MAFAAVAAIAAGAEITTTLVLAAAAEIGTAMTVIGVVTGSKDLMRIGGAVALVGGVGGMINGAISGAAGAAEGAAAAGAEGAVANTAASAADYTNALDVMSDSATAGSGGIVNEAAQAGVGADLSAGMDVGQVPGQSTSQVATQTMGAAPAPAVTSAQPGPTLQAPEVQGPTGAVAPSGPATPYDNIDVGGGYNPAGNPNLAPQDSSSFFSKFSDWANKNQTLFEGGMKLAGTTLSGANQRQMWNQKMALEQQRLNQTSYGSQVGVWAPTAGIINGARQ